MHVWEKGAYYIRVINFSKNYSDVRPTQFTDNYGLAPLSIRRCARAHITHCIHQWQFFHLVFLSHASGAHSIVYERECRTRNKCFGEILKHIFYSELIMSVLYSFWQADDHQMCWGEWEQSNWASGWWQLSYDVALTGHDADRIQF